MKARLDRPAILKACGGLRLRLTLSTLRARPPKSSAPMVQKHFPEKACPLT